jgi:hypothetical protein
MKHEEARRLLERAGVLRHPCDLDLLLFFARHPRALISSEQLAAWLGYELKQIADSLDVLLNAGVLTRMQNPTHAARMYVFASGGPAGGWLPPLLAFASTREGRLAMVDVLSRRTPKETDSPTSGHAGNATVTARLRPVVVRLNRDQKPDVIAG